LGEEVSKYKEIKERCQKTTAGKWKFKKAMSEEDIYFDCHTDAGIKDEYGNDYSIIAALGQSRGDIQILLKALELVCKFEEPGYKDPNYWIEQAEKE
jgi:hypothetical protein